MGNRDGVVLVDLGAALFDAEAMRVMCDSCVCDVRSCVRYAALFDAQVNLRAGDSESLRMASSLQSLQAPPTQRAPYPNFVLSLSHSV